MSHIFGFPNDSNLRSSMTLFALASGSASRFDHVLERYFDGKRDERTLVMFESNKSKVEPL